MGAGPQNFILDEPAPCIGEDGIQGLAAFGADPKAEEMGKLGIVDPDIRALGVETQCEIDIFAGGDQELRNVLTVASGDCEQPFRRRLQNCAGASEMIDQPVEDLRSVFLNPRQDVRQDLYGPYTLSLL